VEEKCDKHNLKLVRHSAGKETMPIEEEKRDLGKYYKKFGSSPKSDADVAWRAALKR